MLARRAISEARAIQQLHQRTMATTTKAQRENQICQLPDGRVLGFAEYGVPAGTPLLFFHGFPSSRLEGYAADGLARHRNVRLLCIDRPGFGLSTPQPGRSILDWAADVENFAHGVGLSRFAVIGGSGGGPYALACAHALPRDMLSAVGLFASGPPWAAGAHHMSVARRWARWMALNMPGALAALLQGLVSSTRWVLNVGFVSRWLENVLGKQAEKSAAEHPELHGLETAESDGSVKTERTDKERKDDLIRMMLEAPYAQGTKATVDETLLLSAPDWGFRLEDVEYNKVQIWHGVEDKNAPIAAIRYLAERVPHAELHELEGDSHYTMFKHLDNAMKEVIEDSEKKS